MPEQAFALEARDLSRHYQIGMRRAVKAVESVSIAVRQGETLALVGESGCGKSTLSRVLMRLERPTAGRVLIAGDDVTDLAGDALRQRRRGIQMIFQDPYASLDPRMTAAEIVREPLDNFRIGTLGERRARVLSLLDRVGLAATFAKRYPHELSGGQRQRLGIARALSLAPRVLIADEPVSALDVSIQAQIINLLADIQTADNLAILFISHDIGTVAHISDRVAIMYLGRIVEIGPTAEVLAAPLHPYAQALLDAVPARHPRERRQRRLVPGDLPSPTNPPPGCAFHTRCPIAIARCRGETPLLRRLSVGHEVACHLTAGDAPPTLQESPQ